MQVVTRGGGTLPPIITSKDVNLCVLLAVAHALVVQKRGGTFRC